MKLFKNIICVAICLIAYQALSAPINLVVFSRNRPLQLDAFLESFDKNTHGCKAISIIFKADTPDYRQGYMLTQQRYPAVRFLEQSAAENDFKRLVLKAAEFENDGYIVFAVDDIIITRPVDFHKIIDLLKDNQAEGFYLRLGTHITECYSQNRKTGVPDLHEVLPGVYSWEFRKGQGDWGYPHSVDMVVYRKKDIKPFFLKTYFNNPNILEGAWACQNPHHQTGLCYEYACIVNCPLNIVQTTFKNRHSNECLPEELLDLYLQGYKLDIEPLQNCINRAPHMDYKPTFIAQ